MIHMRKKVMLIGMPWHQADILSIQLGCLKAFLNNYEGNVQVDTRHYYKDIVGYLNIPTYREILYSNTGELFFAALMFPEKRNAIEKFIKNKLGKDFDFEGCLTSIEMFVRDILKDVAWQDYYIVGFTTTHGQFLASSFLAKLVKERVPETKIVFGGMLLVGELACSILEVFPFIDFIVTGEGEIPLRKLALALREEERLVEVPSLVYKDDGTIQVNAQKEIVHDLDSLPLPDYVDYFRYNLQPGAEIPYTKISVEASRGCWWGKCVFCVENTEWRRLYRRKTSQKVVGEIENLTRKWKSLDLVFTDPDVSDKIDVFEAIQELDVDLNISAEVTGFITKKSLKILRNAGVSSIQIGIESFNNRLLTIYNKGVDLMKMVELLKWCGELGISLCYNVIVGAPFETQEDLKIIGDNIEYLKYLQPPRISHFLVSYQSMIFFNPEKYNISELLPPEEVKMCYPMELSENLTPLLSFHAGYDFKPENRLDYTKILSKIEEWERTNSLQPSLFCKRGEDFINIEMKTREKGEHIIVEGEIERQIYLLCMEQSQSIEDIHKKFPDTLREEIEDICNRFVQSTLMFTDGKRYFSLASFK